MALTPDYEQRAQQADTGLKELAAKVKLLQAAAEKEQVQKLKAENADLQAQIEEVQRQLIAAEAANGKRQIALPGQPGFVPPSASSTPAPEPATATTAAPAQKSEESQPQKKKKKKEKKAAAKPAASKDAPPVDVSRVQFKVGKIVDVSLHPEADKLYLEKIDAGEDEPRTILSGLVEHVPIEEMKDRLVMIMSNLKPRKMRGIPSQGMVMCASLDGKIEILAPPTGAVPGDVVKCAAYPGEPDLPHLNPKKKIFEAVKPDLLTNADGVATYKGKPLEIEGKGAVKSTLANAQIS